MKVVALVSRKGVEAALAQGYVFAKPDGKEVTTADGKVMRGDAIVMEISEEAYKKLQENRRAGYVELATRVAGGQGPISAADLGDGVTGLFAVQDVGDPGKRRG